MMDRLTLTLRPHWGDGSVTDMVIDAEFCGESLPRSAGALMLQYPAQAYGGRCPFPEYQVLSMTDDLGDLPYHTGDAPCFYESADCKGFYPEREVLGTLRWSVRILPRILPEGYSSSPYVDFRAEPLGLNGCGLFAFILPVTGDAPLLARLDWDLSGMPDGARGIWSFGEGSVEKELTVGQVRMTMFQTGLMHAYERGGLGVYWFSEPDFDVEAIAARLYPVYRYMQEYFHDTESCFRVFLRRDPFKHSGGGTACPYSFISGYSAFGGNDGEAWFSVLVHEMTHTWPSMDDGDGEDGDTTWFNEGCTEFYSTMLPWRGGYSSVETAVRELNEKICGSYLTNPYRLTSNRELQKIQWQDLRAQKIPYGRGFLYLANVDAKLRRLGKGSIDEFVFAHDVMHPASRKEWVDFIRAKLGESGVEEFADMTEGKLIVPEAELFGSDIVTVQDEIQLDGRPVISWHWEAADV